MPLTARREVGVVGRISWVYRELNFIIFFLLRGCKVHLLCHVWNKSYSSLLCNNKKICCTYCICIVLFSFNFYICCVPYLKKGVNEAVTLSVVRKFIWKKSLGGHTSLQKLKTVENLICCKLLALETNLQSLVTCSKFRFIPPSSIWDMTGYSNVCQIIAAPTLGQKQQSWKCQSGLMHDSLEHHQNQVCVILLITRQGQTHTDTFILHKQIFYMMPY